MGVWLGSARECVISEPLASLLYVVFRDLKLQYHQVFFLELVVYVEKGVISSNSLMVVSRPSPTPTPATWKYAVLSQVPRR